MPRTRYEHLGTHVPLRALPAAALRAVLREGYGRAELQQDILAGIVVGIVALPLSMALALAVGVSPQRGLYTAIVAGFAVAALGGSRMQVTGPTAAFIVVLAPIYTRFGPQGLMLAGFCAGLILIAMGLLRLGSLISYVPHPVTTGFTAGIATVIATMQLKDALGLYWTGSPEHYLERVQAMWTARGTASLAEIGVAAATLSLLITVPRVFNKVPASVIVLPLSAAGAYLLVRWVPGIQVATIGSRFQTEIAGRIVHGIPQLPPVLTWPFGQLSFGMLREILPSAFAIAMLGAIESLLSAVVADGMARTRHDPDAELLGLGIGNVLAPLFGGIAATGAIARTATNVRAGARSPIAAMIHSLTILGAVLLFAPLIAYLPMAALAALLLIVAWNMSEVRHFAHILRVAPRSDVAVLLTCYTLTVLFDMVVAVSVGVVLASFLFMRRMVEVTEVKLTQGQHPALPDALPEGVVVYDIDGPLFFGAAQKAMGALGSIADHARVVVMRMDAVPVMDATGLVALESAISRLRASHCLVIISGLARQPGALLAKSMSHQPDPEVVVCSDTLGAIRVAEEHLQQRAGASSSPATNDAHTRTRS